jgi:hypothetical protein
MRSLVKLPNRTYPALGLSMLDRAVKEFYAKRCPKSDLEVLRRYFRRHGGLRCIYCLSTDVTRWDHVHPISQGGDTVNGNLVPACSSCDDSKQDKTLDEWFASKSEKRPPPQRHSAIKRAIACYQSAFGYRARPFRGKLRPEQRETYDEFRRKLAALRGYLERKGITTGRKTT